MATIESKDIQEFCHNLKLLRQNAGWTQEELANKVGVSRQTITSIENRKLLPSLTLFIAVASIFVVGAAFNPVLKAVVKALGIDKVINKIFTK